MASRLDLPVRGLQAAILAAGLVLGLLAGVNPTLALVAALALAFVVLVMADLTIGLCLFAVVIFLDVLPFGGVTVTFAKAAGLLLALSWLATLATRKEAENDFASAHPLFTYLLLLFLAWGAVSLLWAEDAGKGLESLYRYALNLVFFLIVFTGVRRREHAVWVLAAFLIGASLSAVSGVLDPAPPDNPNDLSRLGGAGVDPNTLAALLVAALGIAAAFAAGWRYSPLVRVLSLGAIAFCAAGIFMSLSRSGLIALGVMLVAAVFLAGRWRPAAAVLLAVLALGAVGYFTTYADPMARERVTTAETGRTDIWAIAWRMVEANAWQGVGVGNFTVASIHYLLEPGAIKRDDFIVGRPRVAHNTYLEVLAELGIVGLCLFLAIVACSLGWTLRAARAFRRLGDRRMELLTRALLISMLGLLASCFFLSEEFNKQLWLLMALGPALLAIARRAEREGAAPRAA